LSSPIISVENLSKAYRIGVADEKHDTLAATVASWVKAPFRNLKRLSSLNTTSSPPAPSSPPAASDIHWALRDVSFDVNEGEVVGIIGRNGAGKSTLLKILSRITDPTSGRALIRGRVSSLLEVGTGFHPELSGRDNIYMNGTILGMRKKEIDQKFDEIVDFSGIEKFIDTPIKRYSSGMKVRLAFSVAAHLEPEILIIDEVLAVGDFEFQNKCLGKMQDVSSHGRTVLFVSHNMAAVQALCSRCVLLNQGTVLAMGDTADIIRRFTSLGYDPNTAGGIFQRVDFPEVRPPFYLTRAMISRQNSEQPQT
jgi:lipopolysaccharide transport system ATP-binding protein